MSKQKKIRFEKPSEALILVNRYLYVFIILIIALTLIAGYLFLLSPQIEDIKSAEIENTETQERKRVNENLIKRIKDLEEEYQDIKTNRQQDLEDLYSLLPPEPQIAELFVTANQLAQRTGFELLDLNITQQNPENNEVQATDTETESSSPYKTLVLNVSIASLAKNEDEGISGAQVYENFKEFLDDLEKHLRIMDIQTISFPPLGEEAAGVPFEFTIITYYAN